MYNTYIDILIERLPDGHPTNIILNTLSRLEIINKLPTNLKNLELDVLFTVIIIIIKITNKFR